MTKEMKFFLFLIERYAKAKGRMTGETLTGRQVLYLKQKQYNPNNLGIIL